MEDPPVVFDLVSSGDGWLKPTAADVVLLTVDTGGETKVIEYDLQAENAVQSVAGKGVGARFAAAFTQEEPLDANSILFGVASTPFGSLLSSHLQKCVVGDAFRVSCDSASASGGSDGGPAVGSSRVVVTLEAVLSSRLLETLPEEVRTCITKTVVKEPTQKLQAETADGSTVTVRYRFGADSPWTERRDVVLGNGDLPDLLEFAVAGMGDGEVSYLQVSDEDAASCFGLAALGAGEELAGRKLAVAVEVAHAVNVPREWRTLAPARKKKGSDLLQSGRALLARRVFAQTAKFIRQEVTATSIAVEGEIGQVFRACLLNLSLADLKLAKASATSAQGNAKRFFATSGVKFATEILGLLQNAHMDLTLSPADVSAARSKALFRRAQAHEVLHDYTAALADAKALIADSPKSKEFLEFAHKMKAAKSSGSNAAKTSTSSTASSSTRGSSKLAASMFGGGEDIEQRTAAAQAREREAADRNPQDERMPPGLSPMDIARRQGHGEIVTILEEHQKKQQREKEARHAERREAGCMNSDTEDEDGADRRLLKVYREKKKASEK